MTWRKLSVLAAIAVISCSAIAFTQPLNEIGKSTKSESSVMANSGLSKFSLFDPSRLRIRHSYSVSVFSGGGQSQTIAAYLNQIDYQFAKPLRLSIGLAYLHQPQGLIGASTNRALNNRILPSFQLIWEPSKNFNVGISYETYAPGLYYPRSSFGRYQSLFD